jgi:hypothetical protein
VSAADHSAIGFAQKDAEQLSVSNASGLDIELMEPLFEQMATRQIRLGFHNHCRRTVICHLLVPSGARLILAQIGLGPKRLPMIVMGIGGDGGFRRISPVPVRPSEGPLTEPTPAVQPSRRKPLFILFGGTVGGWCGY